MAKLFHRYRAQLNPNGYPVTVTSEPASKEEKISLTVHEKRTVVPITVKNSGGIAVDFSLQVSDLVRNIFTVRHCHGGVFSSAEKHTLKPGKSFKVEVHFDSDHAGFYEQLLVFKFETHLEEFEIMRLLEVEHLTSVRVKPKPKMDPEPAQKEEDRRGRKYINLLKIRVPLKGYAIPKRVRNSRSVVRELQTDTTWENYAQRFQLLLHLEELQLQKEVDIYFQDSVTLLQHGSLFVLQIPGLSKDSSLKLSECDVLVHLFWQTGIDRTETFKGYVQYVKAEQVFLSLFKWPIQIEDLEFKVKFVVERLTLRVQHRALEQAKKLDLSQVLFPPSTFSSRTPLPCSLQANSQGSNPEQRRAVEHILATTAKPAPYLVFGPPGTGKTSTLVEAIYQIVTTKASCNILVCAPSNSATDHLCVKISERIDDIRIMYRLYAVSCDPKKVTKERKFLSNLGENSVPYVLPSVRMLKRYRIMVTTLQTAARLVAGRFPVGFYSYIFVDEAGQAKETECIIPIAGLMKQETCQVVLAGDPNQLGPIINSPIADKCGLGVSLLERLMRTNDLYMAHEGHGFNSCFVTKLLRNYRSHPAILKIPNELFYRGELQPYAAKEKCNSYCNWELLPKKGFPLIFHGVAGIEERDPGCASIYNMAEVEVLKEYLKALVAPDCEARVNQIEPNEIGIIAPYRKQVEKIQEALLTDEKLQKINLKNVLVGTVEKFQGKESQVIIVSTVRSHRKMTEKDQRFTLGFIRNEKRFNVAMTRAQALLIVVGDPRALRTDLMWNKFIHYCCREGGYRGIRVSDAEEDYSPSVGEE
ncbi:putative helicase mov-10-B.1 [Xyrichtys novacula]|uniref:RNA helicase n=1 Tax=Xyrichtys novacula TaxID=13765 RepID=A0AAV1HK47_XYRNO|nr:putative helicase mov-10-B.1 [Xyrichtys novacula]